MIAPTRDHLKTNYSTSSKIKHASETTAAPIRRYAHLRPVFQSGTASQAVNTAMAGQVRSNGKRSGFTWLTSHTRTASPDITVVILCERGIFFQFILLSFLISFLTKMLPCLRYCELGILYFVCGPLCVDGNVGIQVRLLFEHLRACGICVNGKGLFNVPIG